MITLKRIGNVLLGKTKVQKQARAIVLVPTTIIVILAATGCNLNKKNDDNKENATSPSVSDDASVNSADGTEVTNDNQFLSDSLNPDIVVEDKLNTSEDAEQIVVDGIVGAVDEEGNVIVVEPGQNGQEIIEDVIYEDSSLVVGEDGDLYVEPSEKEETTELKDPYWVKLSDGITYYTPDGGLTLYTSYEEYLLLTNGEIEGEITTEEIPSELDGWYTPDGGQTYYPSYEDYLAVQGGDVVEDLEGWYTPDGGQTYWPSYKDYLEYQNSATNEDTEKEEITPSVDETTPSVEDESYDLDGLYTPDGETYYTSYEDYLAIMGGDVVIQSVEPQLSEWNASSSLATYYTSDDMAIVEPEETSKIYTLTR